MRRDIYNLSFDQMKTIEECEKCATVDDYGDDEISSGWLTCLEEVFEGVNKAKLGKEIVKLEGFDVAENIAVVKCRVGNRCIRTTFDSLDFTNLTRAQELWLRAWLQWQKNSY